MVSEPEGRIVVPVWVDDDVVKALINDSGYMPVNVQNWLATQDVRITGCTITVPVSTSESTSTQRAYSYRWVNSAWHKNPMGRGYTNVARSYLTATSTGAGWVYAYTGATPTDYIRVIEGFTMQHSDPAGQPMRAGVWNTVTNVSTLAYQNCGQYVYYGEPIDLTIAEDEKFFIAAYAAGAGVVVSGYYACRQIYIGG